MSDALVRLVLGFYDARARHDETAIRGMLAEDVVWHEPKVSANTGDLHGRNAVLDMMHQAQSLTDGTFTLNVSGVLANAGHAVALIDWTARKAGRTLQGSEFAVFAIRDHLICEVWFFQQDMRMDAEFWTTPPADASSA